MAQDFAKSRKSSIKPGKPKPARAATRNNPEESRHWSWFFTGLCSGVLFCVIGYFTLGQIRTGVNLIDSTITGQPETNEVEPGTNLEFYEYLPQAEVAVDVIPVTVTENVREETNPVTYLLQAASFQNPNDAEELRAKLILLNLDARIVPTNLSGKTWYRVQAGPFIGRNMMEAAETVLIQNNIDPIRMRIPTP